jgi:hypothetical protein
MHRSNAILVRGVDIGSQFVEYANGLDLTFLSRYIHRSAAILVSGVDINSQLVRMAAT